MRYNENKKEVMEYEGKKWKAKVKGKKNIPLTLTLSLQRWKNKVKVNRWGEK
jgi:hypothetical protein